MAVKHGEKKDQKVTGKMIVGDLLKVCPEAREVFKKHLGPYCLSVPGSTLESIEFLAAMYDYHEEPLLEDLNRVCKDIPPLKEGHF